MRRASRNEPSRRDHAIIPKVTHIAVPCPPQDCNITQSIFRPAPRRERLGEHPVADRRDGGLKMGWTKPLGCGVAYGY